MLISAERDQYCMLAATSGLSKGNAKICTAFTASTPHYAPTYTYFSEISLNRWILFEMIYCIDSQNKTMPIEQLQRKQLSKNIYSITMTLRIQQQLTKMIPKMVIH
jgi:hypothetical protein